MQCITFGGKEVSAENCDPKARPAKMKECKTKRCATNWKVGPWGAVSQLYYFVMSIIPLRK